jgi:hypothetical protein
MCPDLLVQHMPLTTLASGSEEVRYRLARFRCCHDPAAHVIQGHHTANSKSYFGFGLVVLVLVG